MRSAPIGIFDSGYGGLTVLKEITRVLPEYDYIYLGDNARNPYGTRSFEAVYQFTFQCVEKLFSMGCQLVILACNTASAKALRTIQQKDLPHMEEGKRVLGVIRPTAEVIGEFSNTGHVGVLGTPGTIKSASYILEIEKFFPHLIVTQQACPMWVPLVENHEHLSSGADYFVKKYIDELLSKDPLIDTVLLGCTHYPLLLGKIQAVLDPNIRVISQGAIVADGLKNYLFRHPEIESNCRVNSRLRFFTTDSDEVFNANASVFFGKNVISEKIHVG